LNGIQTPAVPTHDRVERALERALELAIGPSTPPGLVDAMRYSVFPGGGRVRPTLVLAVAEACGGVVTPVADAAAAAVELLHCASLVHDDLPCFDDAESRRGRPSVHVAYGPGLAVLVGDGLIVAAFEALAAGCRRAQERLPELVRAVAAGVGSNVGIIAGQAWESEPHLDLWAYHQAKTGALFEASVRAGAIAGGGDPEAWAPLGRRVGEAYQIADDVADVVGSAAALGKPVGQDAARQRPSAARALGVAGAHARIEALLDQLGHDVPPCPGREGLLGWLDALRHRLAPARRGEARPVGREAYLDALAVAG
jgi:geranylgeranyl diphosphate synthase, type II